MSLLQRRSVQAEAGQPGVPGLRGPHSLRNAKDLTPGWAGGGGDWSSGPGRNSCTLRIHLRHGRRGPPQPQLEPSRSERAHTPVANLPAMPTPREGQWPAAGLADPSDPSEPPLLTAAVAFRAAGTMAGSGADMLLPHIHRLDLQSTSEPKGRTGTRPRPKGLRGAVIPGPPQRARAQARARQPPRAPRARVREASSLSPPAPQSSLSASQCAPSRSAGLAVTEPRPELTFSSPWPARVARLRVFPPPSVQAVLGKVLSGAG